MKFENPDGFWDVRDRERKIREDYKMRVDGLERAIGLGKRIASVKNQPGWVDFLKAMEDRHTGIVMEIASHDGSSEQLWALQGRLKELKSLLALARNPERNLEALAKSLAELQDHFRSNVEPRLKQETT